MPDISAAVLARRERDLSGFTDKYQGLVEARVGKYANEMLPVWKNAAKKLQERAKKLFSEVGYFETLDTKDAARKVKALTYEAARLEQLAADMAEDIKKVETQLQPYFTSVIKHEFESGYYYQAFGMEQAAQVVVQTPLLTADRVLGIVANPWLEDSRNYSARLRLNTANLAVKMRGVMSEAVTYGWGWNETARRIGEVAGEGYFNSVRLARTELNRAASLGSSYMMMENADILDGKRWNATLDSRTAAKDAANDGRIYDLDYDTPDNPGVAGQRIPNHPNCRCKWTPVLSALGVSTKERIARGNGDSPSQFGERTYTKARTYKEYAKERGLPDLDERLAKENPKRYLRPGETVADINKQVKRWSYQGNTIVVPKPIWENAASTAVQTAQAVINPEPATKVPTLGEKIKARIAQGLETEADVRDVGAIFREEVEKELYPVSDELTKLEQEAAELQRKKDALNAEFAAKNMKDSDPEFKKLWEEYLNLGAQRIKVIDQIVQIKNGSADPAPIITKYLKQVRAIGNHGKVPFNWVKGSSKDVKAIVEKIQDNLPADWVSKSKPRFVKAKKTKRGYFAQGKTDQKARIIELMEKYRYGQDSAIDVVADNICISGLSEKRMRECAYHEFGHFTEFLVPRIKELEKQFYDRRTAGDALEWLGAGYARNEKTRKDKFISKYMGKDYSSQGGGYYELLSMGLESIYTGSYNLRLDPEFADFIYGILVSL